MKRTSPWSAGLLAEVFNSPLPLAGSVRAEKMLFNNESALLNQELVSAVCCNRFTL